MLERWGTVVARLLEAERRRWILWAPVAFGAGIAVYFGLSVEPPWWTLPVVVSGLAVGGCWSRWRCWPLQLGLWLAVAGFGLAALRTAGAAAPVLRVSTGVIELEGRVAEVEPMEQGAVRLLLDRLVWPVAEAGQAVPQRIRIRLRREAGDWFPGQRLRVPVVLMPPPRPAAPGAFDFARQAWFLGIGAVGYAVARPHPVDAGFVDAEGLFQRLAQGWSAWRHALTGRIVRAVGDAGLGEGCGAVAAALITGERGAVPPDLLQAYRDAGLAHILVIAGMHMSMVAGLAFVWLRAGLAAIPWIALRFPIKKWTAGGALAVIFGYLLISGAPVPTQRAFVMNAMMLVAVLIDRDALSLRSITWAALAILAWHPEAIIGASFQMSFAAVYALIAGYEVLGARLAVWRRRHWSGRLLAYPLGILLTTQIAGMATAFFTIYHFNRFATYGLLGNILAVPLVGFLVMPAALVAFCLLPFDLDAWGWVVMGWGIRWIGAIARWVSSLPGASVDLPAVPMPALLLFALGGLWLLLWRRPWRLAGLLGLVGGVMLYGLSRPPDLWLSETGTTMAVRAPDGRLAFSPGSSERVTRETWVRLSGGGKTPLAWYQVPQAAMTCGHASCQALVRGREILFQRVVAPPSCPSADLVVGTVLSLPCPAKAIGAHALKEGGARVLWLGTGGMEERDVAGWQGCRPWSPCLVPQ